MLVKRYKKIILIGIDSEFPKKMSYLADHQVQTAVKQGKIIIVPYFDYFQGPSCYYCHLGQNFLIPKKNDRPYNPLNKTRPGDYFTRVKTNKPFILEAKSFVLAETFELLGTNTDHTIRLFNSSSLARCGISHLALGMINPGCGYSSPIRLTLELVNNAPYPIELVPTTIIKSGKIKFGTEVIKASIVNMDKKTTQSYETWHARLFNQDKKVSGSKMSERYQRMPEFTIDDDFPYEKY